MVTISVREMAAIKRAAQDVAPLSVKKAKATKKIYELYEEVKTLEDQIEARQGYIKSIANGMTTEDLIIRSVEPYLNSDGTQKLDANGRPLTLTKYNPNPAVVIFDEEKRQYYIIENSTKVEPQAETAEVNIDVEEPQTF